MGQRVLLAFTRCWVFQGRIAAAGVHGVHRSDDARLFLPTPAQQFLGAWYRRDSAARGHAVTRSNRRRTRRTATLSAAVELGDAMMEDDSAAPAAGGICAARKLRERLAVDRASNGSDAPTPVDGDAGPLLDVGPVEAERLRRSRQLTELGI